MTELMTAAKARVRIDNMLDHKAEVLKGQVKQQVEAAVEEGRSDVAIKVEEEAQAVRVKGWLEKLGYEINSDCQMGSDWFRVSW